MKKTPVVNKVAQKAILKIDLESFIPKATDSVAFDIKGFLFKELLLKEKNFRQDLKEYDFSALVGKSVYIHCSNAAIIPLWAYMLLTTYINPIAKSVTFAKTSQEAEELFVLQAIQELDLSVYENQRVIVKNIS